MSIKSAMENFAQENRMQYDDKASVIFGQFRGFHFSLSKQGELNSMMFCVSVQTDSGQIPNAAAIEAIRLLCKESKRLLSCEITGRRLVFTAKPSASIVKRLELAKGGMEEVVAYLSSNGYQSVCQECSTTDGIGTFIVNRELHCMCDSCFANLHGSLEQNRQAVRTKKGNVFTGIVGALLGSLLGVAAIVLVSQMGYIAAISGIIMAVCTLKGYELLGGKVDLLAIILSSVIMLGMTWVGHNIDWAIFISGELDTTVPQAYRAIGPLLKSGVLERYYLGLGMLLTFVIVGAVPTIISIGRKKSGVYSARKAERTL